MLVLKFGGTSLGSAERIKNVAEIVNAHDNCVVVCSAMAGVTNALEQVNKLWEQDDHSGALDILGRIQYRFDVLCQELFYEQDIITANCREVKEMFAAVRELLQDPFSGYATGNVLSLGEWVTSRIINNYLCYTGKVSTYVNALELIRLNEQDEPDPFDLARRIKETGSFNEPGIYITQGYICMDSQGRVSNLKRGGSDYTATLLGAALHASLIEIWTDIDGLHNNDPRYVEDTMPIRELSFAEAAELAYFGAKILHPSCVWPAREQNIPIQLKNTMDPDARGTHIQSRQISGGIKAIAAKDNITVLRITSGRMFNAYGFLHKLFQVFDEFKIPVDVVTTSEVSVSVTIEDTTALAGLVLQLQSLGRVSVETNRSIVCVVGNIQEHLAEVIQAVKPFSVDMVSLGASSNNITLVVPHGQKVEVLQALHNLVNNNNVNRQESWIQLQA
ncbi:MAG: aspartate kinase [Bacteroidales bacterium]|nr:aspartate kinase [Bacteroidales bacterium]